MSNPPTRPWHAEPIDAVLGALDSSVAGLTAAEAARRLQQFGPNALEESGRISWVSVLVRQFKNVLVVILLLATLISIILGQNAGGWGDCRDRASGGRPRFRTGVPGRTRYRSAAPSDRPGEPCRPERTGRRGTGARDRPGRRHSSAGRRSRSGRRAPRGGRQPPRRRERSDRRVGSGRETVPAALPGRVKRRRQDEHGVCRHRRHLWPRPRRRDRDRDDHRVRSDRGHAPDGRARPNPPPGQPRPRRSHPGQGCARYRGRHRRGRPATRAAPLGDAGLRYRARRRGRARGIAGGRDHLAGHWRSAHGTAEGARAPSARGRDVGEHQGHLLRQDRHLDKGRDDGPPSVDRRRGLRCDRRWLRPERELRQGWPVPRTVAGRTLCKSVVASTARWTISSIMPSSEQYALSENALQAVIKEVYKHTGITLNEQKKDLLSGRLRRRVRALKMESIGEYVELLCSNRLPPRERDAFIDVVTTHKTSFFRTKSVWDHFSNAILPEVGQQMKPLRIWSAACSTGEEVYSIAIECEERKNIDPNFRFSVLASDVSSGVVQTAKEGKFSENRIREAMEKRPALRWNNYVLEEEGGGYRIQLRLVRNIEFKTHNLFNAMRGQFDIIFVRNVFIYFSDEDKAKVVRNLSESLFQGGRLIIGESESLLHQSDCFEYEEACIYRKRTR